MGYCKERAKKAVYQYKLLQEIRETSNKQCNLTPKGIRKRTKKPKSQ